MVEGLNKAAASVGGATVFGGGERRGTGGGGNTNGVVSGGGDSGVNGMPFGQPSSSSGRGGSSGRGRNSITGGRGVGNERRRGGGCGKKTGGTQGKGNQNNNQSNNSQNMNTASDGGAASISHNNKKGPQETTSNSSKRSLHSKKNFAAESNNPNNNTTFPNNDKNTRSNQRSNNNNNRNNKITDDTGKEGAPGSAPPNNPKQKKKRYNKKKAGSIKDGNQNNQHHQKQQQRAIENAAARERAAEEELKREQEAAARRLSAEREAARTALKERLTTLEASTQTCRYAVEVCTQRANRRKMLLDEKWLQRSRTDFLSQKKSLKSDVKKCTAFCRKIKGGAWQERDARALNLSRYVEEVASAVMEVNFKGTDVGEVVAVCAVLHERYPEFIPTLLLPRLLTTISSDPNVRPRRACLRLFVELALHGVVSTSEASKHLCKLVGEAAGAPKGTSVNSNNHNTGTHYYAVLDANVVVAFAKAAGHEMLGVAPKSLQDAMNVIENAVAEADMKQPVTAESRSIGGEVASNNVTLQISSQGSQGEGKNNVIPTESISSGLAQDLPMNSVTTKISYSETESIDLDMADLQVAWHRAVQEASSLLRDHLRPCLKIRALPPEICEELYHYCNGAYQSLAHSCVTTHAKVAKLEARCEQDRLLVGSISEAREAGRSEARRLLETLRQRVDAMAEALGGGMPTSSDLEPAIDKEDSQAEETAGVGLELWKEEGDGGNNGAGENGEDHPNHLGPFDDEETKSFYCDLPDLLTTIPPALLGWTQADVDRIQAENVRRYGNGGSAVVVDGDSDVLDVEHPPTSASLENIDDHGTSTADDLNGATSEEYASSPTDESESKDKSQQEDTPHYKLTLLLEQELPECHRRETVDQLAEKFCNNHGASKSSRKRLVRALYQVPRLRLDLLPYYARLTAILQRVFPEDIGNALLRELEAQFHGLAKHKKNLHLESRLKNARYIGELTKFRAAPPIVALRCLQRCVEDFTGNHIDVVCCLLETCGRFLYRLKHTKARIQSLMDTVMRIRKAKIVDDRAVGLIDAAIFSVSPPENVRRKAPKIYPPLEAYLRHLFMNVLKPGDDGSVAFTAKQIQRLPPDSGELVCKCLKKAARRGRHGASAAVAEVAAHLRRARPEIATRLIDAVLEELQWTLEQPMVEQGGLIFKDRQRIQSTARLLGELHNASLVPTSAIFDQLHHFLDYGHEIPDALREASARELTMNQGHSSTATSNAALLVKTRLTDADAIPEEEEVEDMHTESKPLDRDDEGRVEIRPVEVVAVLPCSKYDPRVYSHTDPPHGMARIQLVCALLETAGRSLTGNGPKLQRFLASFQRYLFTKTMLPAEVEFACLDLFDALDSYFRTSSHKAGKKGQQHQGSNSSSKGAFVRYDTWLDAHKATVAAEEAEAAAEARAKARLLAMAGVVETVEEEDTSTIPDETILLGDDEEDIDNENDDSVASEDVDNDGDDATIATDGSGADFYEEEEVISDGEGVDSYVEVSEDDDNTENEDDPEDDDEDNENDAYEDDEEEMLDEEAYNRRLEEDAFERELRKLTMEAIEKGKVAARTAKVADTMVHASHYTGPGGHNIKKSTAMNASSISGEQSYQLPTSNETGGQDLHCFKVLKRGHRGRVEAKQILVPRETPLARQATRQDDEAAREREALKARVLQYEHDSAYHEMHGLQDNGNVFLDPTKLPVIRNRPLSLEDIDRNFGSGGRLGGRNSGRGRGRGGRTLRFY